jgi:hypothetical protein
MDWDSSVKRFPDAIRTHQQLSSCFFLASIRREKTQQSAIKPPHDCSNRQYDEQN